MGALLEELHARAPPRSGVFHYAIHAYDHPPLAEKGLPFARGYDAIAPSVPHALHMPSHIFVRPGLWDETADGSRRSAEAALDQPVGDATSAHYAHAIEYLVYADLQMGEVDAAEALLDEFLSRERIQDNFGAVYALSATPAPGAGTGGLGARRGATRGAARRHRVRALPAGSRQHLVRQGHRRRTLGRCGGGPRGA